MRFALDRLLHQQRQRAERLPNIGVACRKPGADVGGHRDHRKGPLAGSIAITFTRVAVPGAIDCHARLLAEGNRDRNRRRRYTSRNRQAAFSPSARRAGTDTCAHHSAAHRQCPRYRGLIFPPEACAIAATAPGSAAVSTSRAFSPKTRAKQLRARGSDRVHGRSPFRPAPSTASRPMTLLIAFGPLRRARPPCASSRIERHIR